MQRGKLRLLSQIESKNVIWLGEMIAESGKHTFVLWKPLDGERDFRPGIPGLFYAREVAAYEISKLMAMENVPESIVYTYNGTIGCVQRWLENAIIGDYINMDYMLFINLPQWQYSAAFDYLIGNQDRHAGNWMVDPLGKLWLIDNAASFPDLDNCWRGSLSVMRPMINRKVNIPDTFKDQLASVVDLIPCVLKELDLMESLPSLIERIKLLLNAKRFSDLVITR